MTKAARIVDPVLKTILRGLCRIDASQLDMVPSAGPLIIMVNHINFLEVPLMHLYTTPRPALGLVKKETWDTPFLGFLARIWEAIPIDRSGVDLSALKQASEHLKNGGIIMLAPEGTRSSDGVLQEAHAGVISLAVRNKSPILPVAHFGGEAFWDNWKHLRRTDVTFKVGVPIKVDFHGQTVTGSKRKAALNELMASLAMMMPEHYHGYYAEAVTQCRRDGFHWLREVPASE
ncbi:lysophospholipid acyltransferase family protein [Sediminispirochaeta bajacaliforniensis]|uniref:lysophospholipid acyltransferase family protein n=1 Tax=Sediminispirochaeta bajacaliforniensis TaxID=148 RepID=UPI00036390E3|nr:lysophospholipid acyltransferase family protein [Sediminispirochaeta bajacaliforniensis]